ncbi:MAG: hypothetical protein F6J93_03215 [Oscillatoria sp. SIO1A7]|nr:hypothetical protein [Oscillatoria sp. SIO1A7]
MGCGVWGINNFSQVFPLSLPLHPTPYTLIFSPKSSPPLLPHTLHPTPYTLIFFPSLPPLSYPTPYTPHPTP